MSNSARGAVPGRGKTCRLYCRTRAIRSSVYTDHARAFVLIVTMACAAGCSQTSKQHDADADLKAVYTAEWTWRETQFPDDEDSQKPIADHLPDVGPAAQEARLKYWLDVERKLDKD